MDRAEALEIYESLRYACLNVKYKQAIDLAFDALREQEQREWISVEERLPEDYERVLVYLDENIGVVLHTDTDRITQNKKWVRWPGNVTHWMPLPMPPKEGAEG